jgi:hypothetical protein
MQSVKRERRFMPIIVRKEQKMKRKLSIIFTGLLLSLLLLLPATVALAAPAATFTPNSGPAGTVTSVTGTGWAGGEVITSVTVGGIPAAHTLVVDGAGNLSGTVFIPATAPGGWNTSVITGSLSGALAFASAFYIQSASISVNPYQGYSGTLITVSGYGWNPGETVRVYYDGALWQTLSPSGSSWSVTLTASGALGYHTITTSGTTSGTQTDSFRIIGPPPYITQSLSQGSPGQYVTITGYNFGYSESVYVTFDGSVIVQGTVDYNGYWSLSFTVPEKPSGSHYIDAYGSTTTAASITNLGFSITPVLTVSPTSVNAKEQVTISGKGFRASSTITLNWGSRDFYATSNSLGSFSTTTVAPDKGADYTITAQDASGYSASDTLTVINPISVAISPATGAIGETISVSGNGLNPGTITITYDGVGVGSISTDAYGNFLFSLKIPKSAAGFHTVAAKDTLGNTASVTFAVESVPPPTPRLIEPSDGTNKGWTSADVTFEWTEVVDPSGVSYSLQLSRDPSFSTVLVNATGLTANSFDKAKLNQGDYYWRVQAVDEAGNSSSWAAPSSFTVSYPPALWPIVGGIFGVAVILALIYLARYILRPPLKGRRAKGPVRVELTPEAEAYIKKIVAETLKQLGPGKG